MENEKQMWKDKWNKNYSDGYGSPARLGIVESHQIFGLIRELRKTDVALEIGCGRGRFTEIIAKKVKEIHGIDISDVAINKAKLLLSKYENVKLHNTVDLSIFKDEMFDLIFSMTVFQHIPRKFTIEYINEAKRLLKKDGILLFQIMSGDKYNERDINKNAKEASIGYSKEKIIEIVENAGLKIYNIKASKETKWGKHNSKIIEPDTNDKWLWYYVACGNKIQFGGDEK